MKKIVFITLICLCLCGCGDKKKNLLKTECTNQSNKNIIVWTLYHDGETIYQISREGKKEYNSLDEAIRKEKEEKSYYSDMKKSFEKQGGKVSININRENNIVISKISYDCSENNFFPNTGCDYKKEVEEFEHDIISFTCIEKTD